MSDDRNLSPESADNQLPVEDLKPRVLDPQAADAVKGGAEASAPKVSEITVSKPTDVASSKMF